jgi:hypothetical protein
MKIFLDDTRTPPNGWILCYWPDDVIELMKTKNVTHISLDHDLGHDKITGYDVLLWLEEKVHYDSNLIIPEITIHSANPVGRKRMENAIKSIHKKSNYCEL